jgi:hypothetical protein
MKQGRREKILDAFNQVQTPPLLAARGLVYTHAQTDFESRPLKHKEKEFATLANRFEMSTFNVPNLSHEGPRRTVGRDHGIDPNFELDDDLERLPSDVLSRDFDLEIKMTRKRRSPYSYYTGATGHHKRPGQL